MTGWTTRRLRAMFFACSVAFLWLPATTAGAATSCLASNMIAWAGRQHPLVGAMMTDATATKAPFDLRYQYLPSQLPDNAAGCSASCTAGCSVAGKSCAAASCNWWGCWQDPAQAPGAYVRQMLATSTQNDQIQMFTYYMFLPGSGAAEGAAEVKKATDVAFMSKYFADFRFLLKQIGSSKALLHIEPDFWGYARQLKSNPANLAAAVATANPTDCAGRVNTFVGLGRCMVAMTRKYAPNARIGFHASPWNISLNQDPSYNVAGDGVATGNFLKPLGGDFVVVDTSDRDAGYYQIVMGVNRWWDATNSTLPNFRQMLTWVTALTNTMGKPALWWQIPLGNSKQTNVNLHWKDNQLAYYFAHMSELVSSNSFGVAYGAGAAGQTTPETDGGVLISQTNAFVNSGGTTVCPP